MRTTLVLDDALFQKIRREVSPRRISEFVNTCIREHFDRLEQEERERELEKAYARVAKENDDGSVLEIEDWPQW